MEVGNRYYCISDVTILEYGNCVLLYKKGNSYTIRDISLHFNNECVHFCTVEDNIYGYTGKYFIIDNTRNNIINGEEWCFLDNYFLSEKELRKQKLKKINEEYR